MSGEFNVVCKSQKKYGTNRLSSYENEFLECTKKLEIMDLMFYVCLYTWINKKAKGDFVAKKLDWVMVNVEWLGIYGHIAVDFMECGVLDHSPACIIVGKVISCNAPKKSFNW